MIVAPKGHHVFLVGDEYVFVPYSERDIEEYIYNEIAGRVAKNEEFKDFVNALTSWGDFLERFLQDNGVKFWNDDGEWNQEFSERFETEMERWLHADAVFKQNVREFFNIVMRTLSMFCDAMKKMCHLMIGSLLIMMNK